MKPVKEMSQAEFGAYVQSYLRANGIEVILSGGAVVGIYSSGRYISKDLDFITIYSVNRRTLRMLLERIGFQEEGRLFKHPDAEYFIEFPAGPPALGSEPIKQILEKEYSTGTLQLISPTDCVKDRLAAYYHWGDRQCLVQAELVAQEQDIDLGEIERWSIAEEKLDEFIRIKKRLVGSSK